MKAVEDFTKKFAKKVSKVEVGDTVSVHTKIKEGGKERIQVFEGVVLRKHGANTQSSVTVRKVSFGIGVERTFLLSSPLIKKIEVKKRAKVRRANIGYLRGLMGQNAKLKDKEFDALAVNVSEEELAPSDKEEIEIKEKIDEESMVQESTEDIAEEETRKAEEEDKELSEDEQKASEEETNEGVEEAQEDIEKGKSSEGEKAEKVVENKEPDLKEEDK